MTLDEYRTLYSSNDSRSPGEEAIDQSLARIYGKQAQALWHWSPIISKHLGGPDPIDGISAYENNSTQPSHFHFCSYGFSSLDYNEELFGKDFSGFGFELTFRLSNKGETERDLIWVCGLIQNLARYIFESGRWFEEHHWMPTNSPIKLECDTDIVGLLFVRDLELPPIATPHGKVEFLQMVGITSSELEDIRLKRRTCAAVAASLRENSPFLVTDLDRRS